MVTCLTVFILAVSCQVQSQAIQTPGIQQVVDKCSSSNQPLQTPSSLTGSTSSIPCFTTGISTASNEQAVQKNSPILLFKQPCQPSLRQVLLPSPKPSLTTGTSSTGLSCQPSSCQTVTSSKPCFTTTISTASNEQAVQNNSPSISLVTQQSCQPSSCQVSPSSKSFLISGKPLAGLSCQSSSCQAPTSPKPCFTASISTASNQPAIQINSPSLTTQQLSVPCSIQNSLLSAGACRNTQSPCSVLLSSSLNPVGLSQLTQTPTFILSQTPSVSISNSVLSIQDNALTGSVGKSILVTDFIDRKAVPSISGTILRSAPVSFVPLSDLYETVSPNNPTTIITKIQPQTPLTLISRTPKVSSTSNNPIPTTINNNRVKYIPKSCTNITPDSGIETGTSIDTNNMGSNTYCNNTGNNFSAEESVNVFELMEDIPQLIEIPSYPFNAEIILPPEIPVELLCTLDDVSLVNGVPVLSLNIPPLQCSLCI